MLFNTYEYILFLVIVLILYWRVLAKSTKAQNILILLASYIFYGWWDWRFLSLIVLSSLVDYYAGLKIASTTGRGRRYFLASSVIFNLGMLGVFKYYNFFAGSMADALGTLGYSVHMPMLQIVLPVGISFYTFQTMSYTIDVYYGKLRATSNMLEFLSFVSFFPQLVAGPIERASNLLHQFGSARAITYNDVREGCLRILWGMFKKVFIADNLSVYADRVFDNYASMASADIVVGVLAFSVQIYCDFSGYSDIAIGSARLLGFRLMENFKYPYFARNIDEFWRRWHISLSTWFRDYFYIPLGGNRNGAVRRELNVLMTFTISGLWHGANWTFLFWGLLNGLYFLPRKIIGINGSMKWLSALKVPVGIVVVNLMILVAWVFFRSSSMSSAVALLSTVATGSWSLPVVGKFALVYIAPLYMIEGFNQRKAYPLEGLSLRPIFRYALYVVLAVAILSNFNTKSTFIYFQF